MKITKNELLKLIKTNLFEAADPYKMTSDQSDRMIEIIKPAMASTTYKKDGKTYRLNLPSWSYGIIVGQLNKEFKKYMITPEVALMSFESGEAKQKKTAEKIARYVADSYADGKGAKHFMFPSGQRELKREIYNLLTELNDLNVEWSETPFLD